MSTTTALLVGTRQTCRRLEAQLDLLARRPITIGWLVLDADLPDPTGDDPDPILGAIDALETVIARRQPGTTIISLPAPMSELIASLRTRLRKLGIPDRFFPTVEDLLKGVGPRTHIDVDYDRLLEREPRQFDERAVRSLVEGKRVLITGAGGSIGSELARIVSRYAPEQILLMDRSENALFEIDRQIARKHPDLPRRAMLHDVVDEAGTKHLLQSVRPQIVFHAAAHKHVPMLEDHPGAAINNNLYGTKAVADAADAAGVERFVLISTDKAVNPTSIMGATKRLAELYVQHKHRTSQTAYCMVRFGNVLGSSGSVLDVWRRQIADGGPVTVTDPAMTRYFMTIPEAATLVVQAATVCDPSCADGEVFVLDMGEPVRIVDLAGRFAQHFGLTTVGPDDGAGAQSSATIRLVYTGIRPGEKLHEELSFDAEHMRPTRHPDINIWQLTPPDSTLVGRILREMEPMRTSRDVDAAARAIRDLLPGKPPVNTSISKHRRVSSKPTKTTAAA